jgi:hypothetical protein
MKINKAGTILLLLSIVIISCKKESISPVRASYDYFPVQQGKYVIYQVDSVVHSDNDGNTDDSIYTFHYQLKEVIGDMFVDGQGRQTEIVKRYRREADSLAWEEVSASSQWLTVSAAYRMQDNIVYHKLAFPINEKITWDGNDANTLTEEMYLYENFHQPRSFNALSFDSTVSVLQRNDENYIETSYGKEIYANHVGLIYKEDDDLHKVNGLIVKGTEFRITVIGFGQE